jgi:hypothetical protein
MSDLIREMLIQIIEVETASYSPVTSGNPESLLRSEGSDMSARVADAVWAYFLPAHDAELTEKVRNAAIEEAAVVAEEHDNAQCDVIHDLIRTLSTTPTPERSNT